MLLVAEDTEVSRELKDSYRSAYGFGGFLKREGRMYQAYAVIDNLGPADAIMVEQRREVVEGGQLRPEWANTPATVDRKMCNTFVFPERLLELRAMFYAHRADTGFASIVNDKNGKWVAVLFEATTSGTTPFWREKENTSAQLAYDEIAEFLPVSGFTQKFGKLPAADSATAPADPTVATASDEDSEEPPEGSLFDELARHQAQEAEAAAERVRIRRDVCEFADNDVEYGWYTYEWKSRLPGVASLTVRAPKRALYRYALSTTAAYHLSPDYKPFSTQGMKTDEDNPLHTDVWLGCGFDIDMHTYSRDNPRYHAVVDMMFAVQKELLKFEVQVLARGPEFSGQVVYPDSPDICKDDILVVPHAGVEFELQALKAGAIICEVGGRLAHLVTVCREMKKPIIRMDDACAKLKPGQHVTVYPDSGKVKVWPGHRYVG